MPLAGPALPAPPSEVTCSSSGFGALKHAAAETQIRWATRMSRKTLAMFVLTLIAILLYASRLVPGIALPVDVSDFFGGAAVGLGIGTIFTWLAERP